jgi:hypothetical protein
MGIEFSWSAVDGAAAVVPSAMVERSNSAEELRKRDLTQVSTARLYAMADALRRQIAHETDRVQFVTPIKAIPAFEFVEQVQEWHA